MNVSGTGNGPDIHGQELGNTQTQTPQQDPTQALVQTEVQKLGTTAKGIGDWFKQIWHEFKQEVEKAGGDLKDFFEHKFGPLMGKVAQEFLKLMEDPQIRGLVLGIIKNMLSGQLGKQEGLQDLLKIFLEALMKAVGAVAQGEGVSIDTSGIHLGDFQSSVKELLGLFGTGLGKALLSLLEKEINKHFPGVGAGVVQGLIKILQQIMHHPEAVGATGGSAHNQMKVAI